jgi:hypothetical protein
MNTVVTVTIDDIYKTITIAFVYWIFSMFFTWSMVRAISLQSYSSCLHNTILFYCVVEREFAANSFRFEIRCELHHEVFTATSIV